MIDPRTFDNNIYLIERYESTIPGAEFNNDHCFVTRGENNDRLNGRSKSSL